MAYTTETIEVEKINKVSFINKGQLPKIVYLIKSKSGIIYQYQSSGLEEDWIDKDLEFLEFLENGSIFQAIVMEKRSKLYKNLKVNKIIKVLLEEETEKDILKDFLSEDES
jgi:hypothetical protein